MSLKLSSLQLRLPRRLADFWLLLRDAVNAPAAIKQRPGVYCDRLATAVGFAQNLSCPCVGVVFTETTRDNPAVYRQVVDVAPVNKAFAVA